MQTAVFFFKCRQACCETIVVDQPWRYADITQLIGRIYEMGQTCQPSFSILIMEGTCETAVHTLLSRKKQFLDDALGVGSNLKDNLTHREVLGALDLLGTPEVPILVDSDDND
jgi:SNF2 family DNA or RNA helicase